PISGAERPCTTAEATVTPFPSEERAAREGGRGVRSPIKSNSLQRGFEVVPEVVGAFQADMQPHDPAQALALVHEPGREGDRNREALEAAPTAPDAEIAQRVDEAIGRLLALRLQFDTQQPSRTAQLAAGQFRLRI